MTHDDHSGKKVANCALAARRESGIGQCAPQTDTTALGISPHFRSKRYVFNRMSESMCGTPIAWIYMDGCCKLSAWGYLMLDLPITPSVEPMQTLRVESKKSKNVKSRSE
jgi:hypothetical protein